MKKMFVQILIWTVFSSAFAFSSENSELLQSKGDRSSCIRKSSNFFSDYGLRAPFDCSLKNHVKIDGYVNCGPISDDPSEISPVACNVNFYEFCFGVCCFPLNVVLRILTFPCQDSTNCCDIMCASSDPCSHQDKKRPKLSSYTVRETNHVTDTQISRQDDQKENSTWQYIVRLP